MAHERVIARVAAEGALENWQRPPAPRLGDADVHVWRISLDAGETQALSSVLSSAERTRAERFHRDIDRRHYLVAHGMLRSIIARYVGAPPAELAFTTGIHGKPLLAPRSAVKSVEFNLAHSGDLALLAVSHHVVGVDIERWNAEIEHFDLAEYCFSVRERKTLRSLADVKDAVVAGFFAAWSRKEAYIKATGHGIGRGLDHFDVSLAPGERARLIADQTDPTAAERWVMKDLVAGTGYSAALVVAAPVNDVLLFDAN